jgi:flagellar motility protein MotE (MotC chaperone)
MSNKLLTVLILVVVAAATFAASFTISRMLGGTTSPAAAASQPNSPAEENGAVVAQETPRIEERHLYDLIKELRQKLRDCQRREEAIGEQEKRVQVARQVLDKEARDLESLRVQAASTVTQLKGAQAELEKTRVSIAKAEQANLKRTAAIYDKMDPAAAAKIFEGMCSNQQDGDAARILYYMQERSVGKLLAEIADKKVTARLCDQMKKVKEQG